MPRYVAQVGLLISLLITSVSEVDAQSNVSFKTAVGNIGSDSFAFGIKLWALSEIQLFPEHNIRVETVEVASESDRLKSLREGRTNFAILDGEVSASRAVELRSVISHRPRGDDTLRAKESLQLVTRADVPRDVVYRITRMIFDHATYVSGNTARAGVAALDHAMEGLSLPVHPGAIKFYNDQADSFSVMFASGDEETTKLSATIDKDALNFDEALQLREACRAAASRGEAEHFIGYGIEAPCDATLLTISLAEHSGGHSGPMTTAGHRGVSDWQTRGSQTVSKLKATEFKPTM